MSEPEPVGTPIPTDAEARQILGIAGDAPAKGSSGPPSPAPDFVPAPVKTFKVACAQCYRESPEVAALDELDWVTRHDGTRVCKRCRPEGQSGVEAKVADQRAIDAAHAKHHSVPMTPEEARDRLAAQAFLREKGVLR